MRAHRLPLLLLLLVCLLVLWPMPLGGGALGHPLSDLADHYWGAWWWGGELEQGRLPSLTTISHLPAGAPFWYVDPVGAAIALVLRPLGFPLAWNLTILLEVFLAGALLYRLAWRRLEHRAAALLAGVVGVSAPYLLGLVHSGLNEYLGLFFPVMLLADTLEALEGRARAWFLGAVGVALCTAQSFYYGAFACLLLCCLLLGPEPRRRARVLLPALLVGIGLSAPILWVAAGTIFGTDGAVDAASAPGWTQPLLPANDLSLFLRPGDHYFPDTPALGNPGILHVHYLGWIALLLAVWGYLRHPGLRPHRWAALLFLVFALGPALVWWGQPVAVGSEPLPLPLALLYRVPGSPWKLVHHPYRLTAFLVPLLALGAAAALSRWPRWSVAVVAPLVLAESLLVSPAVWPLPVTDVQAPAVYASLEEPGGVLDWPPDATRWNRSYQLWQVSHGRAVPYGVNLFLGDELMADPMVAELLRALADPRQRTTNRDLPGTLSFPPSEPGEQSRLQRYDLRYLVLHPQAMGERELRRTRQSLEHWLGEPISREPEAEVWEIPR